MISIIEQSHPDLPSYPGGSSYSTKEKTAIESPPVVTNTNLPPNNPPENTNNASDDNQQQMDIDPNQEQQPPAEDAISSELMPLRKYYLVQKLQELKSKLVAHNIPSEEINFILMFADSLSYDVLLALSDSIVGLTDERLGELANSLKSNKQN